MIIAISGKAGSGKSTVAKEIAKRLNLQHYSIGDMMREMAKKRKVSLMELGRIAETDESIDRELDERQRELRAENNFVIDGRLTAHFIPNADLKVFLDCDDNVRAQRILKDERSDESSQHIKDVVEKINSRERSERERYEKYYKVDFYDTNLYDIVINTTNVGVDNVVKQIIRAVGRKLNSKSGNSGL